MYPEQAQQNGPVLDGRLLILNKGWNLEEGFIGPEPLEQRDRFVGRLARRLVDPSYAVVVPSGPLDHDRYREALEAHGIDLERSWAYGVVTPAHLCQRALKAQVHRPLDKDRPVPAWFDRSFPERIRSATLPGYSCFTEDCLREATATLLEDYARVRLKDPCGAAGKHQDVVGNLAETERALEALKERWGADGGLDDVLPSRGMVVEADLGEAEVWSVTRTKTPDHTFTSIGRQVQTSAGHAFDQCQVYGGTVSLTVRGDTDALRALDLPGGAVARWDPATGQRVVVGPDDDVLRAAGIHLDALEGWERDGIVHTRANVDVLKGELAHRDGHREPVVATVETSGRVGGASPPELLGALDLVANDDASHAVRSSHYLTSRSTGQALRGWLVRAGGTVVWDGCDRPVDGDIVMVCVL